MNSTLKMLNNLEIKFFEGMPDILTYTMDMICLYIYITYIWLSLRKKKIKDEDAFKVYMYILPNMSLYDWRKSNHLSYMVPIVSLPEETLVVSK